MKPVPGIAPHRKDRLSPAPAAPARQRGAFVGVAVLTAFILLAFSSTHLGAQGSSAVVVFNVDDPDSKALAEYYAGRRQVPAGQVLGFTLPKTESISRADYLQQLERPLLERLTKLGGITFGPRTNQSVWGQKYPRITDYRIRYIVVCRGVPSRILRDGQLVETNNPVQAELAGRNEAAVDSQLAVATLAEQGAPWTGPLPSPFFGVTNAALLNPANGLWIVARLDGPSPAIARRLVDQAMAAETNGLFGRAYFDARGLGTNDQYAAGDEFIRGAAQIARNVGFETVLDNTPPTFAPGFPLSQIALYAGWYDQSVSGPFARRAVEFLPGAFAYHLYSFSASTLRSTQSWAGLLLDLGATCTLGYVDEPYLAGTADLTVLLNRWLTQGFTFGEAAYAAQSSLSWQTTVVGDPLYRPFGRSPDDLLADLQQRDPPRLEWYYLMAVNQRLASGDPLASSIQALESLPAARKSAVLTEKLADLYAARGALNDSTVTYETALKRNPSLLQRRRLLLTAAEKRVAIGPDDAALAHYNKFLAENPDHPADDRLALFQTMLPLARRLQLTNEVTRIESEMKRLSPPPK
jgi:uncharacterized protein (TIGR03790 family)